MRKLLCMALAYTAALILAHYLLPEAWLICAAVLCAGLSFSALFFRGRRRTAVLLVCFSAAVGFGWAAAYQALFIAPAEACVGQSVHVSARVLDYAELRGSYSSVEVKLTDETLPGCKVLVYDYAGGFAELRPGDMVDMELELKSARTFYGLESDRYLASGIFLRGALVDEYRVTGRWEHEVLCLPRELARELKESVDRCFPEDVAPLMKALLTGDKTDYYEDDELYVSMQTAGLAHIVAVSGMHVAFIIGLLSLGTGRRRITAFIGLPLIFLFMAMVGFTPSVVRAGIMQGILLLAPILRRENDAPTGLAAALLVLLLANPESVGSISLQLSFAAMAGIILVSPRVYDSLVRREDGSDRLGGSCFGRLIRSLCNLLSSSLGAIVFTTPLVALHFGYVPLYAVLSNLLCIWAMSAAFVLGYLVSLVGLFFPVLGGAAAGVLAWLPRYTVAVVAFVARLPYAALHTANNLVAWWIVYVYAVFILAYLGRGRGRFRPIVPACLCLISFCVLSILNADSFRRDDAMSVTAIDVGQGQSVAVLTENGAVLIDCGSTGSPQNAGDVAAAQLLKSGVRQIDLLVLTHLHADHVNGVERLMNRMTVKRLALPIDCEDDGCYESILTCCEKQDTELYYIENDTDFTMDGLRLTLYAPLTEKDANERGLIVCGDYGEYEFLITGDAGTDVEDLLVSFYELEDMELLMVGHHGSQYSTGEKLLEEVKPETAFISVGLNSYGHPTEDVLNRLAQRGIAVYRTDLHGNISITVGNEHG